MASGSGNQQPNKKLSEEAASILLEGISLVFSRWSALQVAIENEWGGRYSRQLADKLHSDVYSWFTLSKEQLYIDDLEDILDEGMLSLGTEIDDGSIEEVAEKLMIMHEECLEGDYSSVEKLRVAGPRTVSHQHVRQVDDEDDSDDDSMSEDEANMVLDAPQHPTTPKAPMPVIDQPRRNEPDPDGWVTVPARRGKGKRN